MSRKYLYLRKHPLLSGEGNQAKDVLFLFNGMEKMKLDFRIGATELCSDPNEPLPPGAVMVNLLRKYLLPEVRNSPPFIFFSSICLESVSDYHVFICICVECNTVMNHADNVKGYSVSSIQMIFLNF